MLSKQKMNEMKVGDKVFFMSKGRKVKGTIRKKNIKRLPHKKDDGKNKKGKETIYLQNEALVMGEHTRVPG